VPVQISVFGANFQSGDGIMLTSAPVQDVTLSNYSYGPGVGTIMATILVTGNNFGNYEIYVYRGSVNNPSEVSNQNTPITVLP